MASVLGGLVVQVIQLKAGEYTLKASLSPVQLLNKLIKGDTCTVCFNSYRRVDIQATLG